MIKAEDAGIMLVGNGGDIFFDLVNIIKAVRESFGGDETADRLIVEAGKFAYMSQEDVDRLPEDYMEKVLSNGE